VLLRRLTKRSVHVHGITDGVVVTFVNVDGVLGARTGAILERVAGHEAVTAQRGRRDERAAAVAATPILAVRVSGIALLPGIESFVVAVDVWPSRTLAARSIAVLTATESAGHIPLGRAQAYAAVRPSVNAGLPDLWKAFCAGKSRPPTHIRRPGQTAAHRRSDKNGRTV